MSKGSRQRPGDHEKFKSEHERIFGRNSVAKHNKNKAQTHRDKKNDYKRDNTTDWEKETDG